MSTNGMGMVLPHLAAPGVRERAHGQLGLLALASEQPLLRFQRPALPSCAEVEHYFELSRAERWYSNGGPCWRLLRSRLEDRAGAYCVPVASGTLGLMVSMSVAAAGRGSARPRAAMPSFTFPATAQAAIWTGFEPLMVDVEPRGWHLDPALLERALRQRSDIGLAVAVSAFGTPPAVETRERWELTCARAGVPLIIDSAAGFGASAGDGTPVGAGGDMEVVSFHATKPFAVGEGGAVFTRRKDTHERLLAVSNFGFAPDRTLVVGAAFNGKMSELHAATALAVLDRIDEIITARRSAAEQIRARADPRIAWQAGCARSTWQFVPARFADVGHRDRVADSVAGRVEVRRYYEPLHTIPALREMIAVDGPLEETDRLAENLLCLPMANDLSGEEISAIAGSLRELDASPR